MEEIAWNTPGVEWVLGKRLGGEWTCGGVSAGRTRPTLLEASGPLLGTRRVGEES